MDVIIMKKLLMENKMEKTAIQQMLIDLDEMIFNDSNLTTKEIWDKALETEKRQIINAYYAGNDDVKDNPDREGEQYYDETFKSE